MVRLGKLSSIWVSLILQTQQNNFEGCFCVEQTPPEMPMNAEGENSAPSCFRTTAVIEGAHLGCGDPSDASRENDIERTKERTRNGGNEQTDRHTVHTKAQQAEVGHWGEAHSVPSDSRMVIFKPKYLSTETQNCRTLFCFLTSRSGTSCRAHCG